MDTMNRPESRYLTLLTLLVKNRRHATGTDAGANLVVPEPYVGRPKERGNNRAEQQRLHRINPWTGASPQGQFTQDRGGRRRRRTDRRRLRLVQSLGFQEVVG